MNPTFIALLALCLCVAECVSTPKGATAKPNELAACVSDPNDPNNVKIEKAIRKAAKSPQADLEKVRELVLRNNKLPDGRAYAGPDEFKQLLIKDLDRFAEAFVEQLATYALRRVMTMDDRVSIKSITVAAKKDGYKLRSVIEHFVMSDLFAER